VPYLYAEGSHESRIQTNIIKENVTSEKLADIGKHTDSVLNNNEAAEIGVAKTRGPGGGGQKGQEDVREEKHHSDWNRRAASPRSLLSPLRKTVKKALPSVSKFFLPRKILKKQLKNIQSLELRSIKSLQKKKVLAQQALVIYKVADALDRLTFDGIKSWIDVIDFSSNPVEDTPETAPLPFEVLAVLSKELEGPSNVESGSDYQTGSSSVETSISEIGVRNPPSEPSSKRQRLDPTPSPGPTRAEAARTSSPDPSTSEEAWWRNWQDNYQLD
jgi:hypothetical protein